MTRREIKSILIIIFIFGLIYLYNSYFIGKNISNYSTHNHIDKVKKSSSSPTPFPKKSFIYSKRPEYDEQRNLIYSQGKKRYLIYTTHKQKIYVNSLSEQLEKLKIYKSSPERLLEYLVYENDPENAKKFTTYRSYALNRQYIFKKNEIVHGSEDKILEISIPPQTDQFVPIELELPVGIYYLEAYDKSNIKHANQFLVVNSQGLIVRYDDQKLTTSLVNAQTGQKSDPVGTLEIYNLDSSPKLLKSGSLHSLTQIDFSIELHPNLVLAKIGGETLVAPMIIEPSDSKIENEISLDNDMKIFLSTDRPLYSEGEKIKFFGILRRDNDAIYQLPFNKEKITVVYEYNNNKYNRVSEKAEVQTDNHGRFFGELNAWADSEDTEETVYLRAYTSDPALNQVYESGLEIQITNFSKPDFELKVIPSSDKIIGSQDASFTVSQVSLTDKLPRNTLVKYKMYAKEIYQAPSKVYDKNFNIVSQGGMCGGGSYDEWYGEEIGSGEINLKSESDFVRINNERLKHRNVTEITLIATTTDEKNNEIIGSAKIEYHPSNWNIILNQNSSTIYLNNILKQNVTLESQDGKPLFGVKIKYTISQSEPKVSTYSVDNKSGHTYQSGELTTNKDGIAYLEKNLEKGSYEVEYSLEDDMFRKIAFKKSYYINEGGDLLASKYLEKVNKKGPLNFSLDKSTYTVGEVAVVELDTPNEIDIFITNDRGRIYHPQIFRTKAGKNYFQLLVTEELSPSFELTASYFFAGSYYTQGIKLNVPAMHKLLILNLLTDKSEYSVGETMRIMINTNNRQEFGVGANVVISVVDKAIFVLKKNTTPPLHSSFYFSRNAIVNSSSSTSLVGESDNYYIDGLGGGGGNGNPLASGKNVNTLYFNPNLESDKSGKLFVEIPLPNQKTTWRISAYAFTDSTDLGQNFIDIRVK